MPGGLVGRGVRQLIAPGSETPGECTRALSVRCLRIGQQIAPGVPWRYTETPVAGPQGLHIALKSGKFGAVDYFTKVFERLS